MLSLSSFDWAIRTVWTIFIVLIFTCMFLSYKVVKGDRKAEVALAAMEQAGYQWVPVKVIPIKGQAHLIWNEKEYALIEGIDQGPNSEDCVWAMRRNGVVVWLRGCEKEYIYTNGDWKAYYPNLKD